MEFTGVTITGGVFIESAGAVPVDNDFVLTVIISDEEDKGYTLEMSSEIGELSGTIYWGDGSNTAYNTDYVYEEHTYSSLGTYEVRVVGEVDSPSVVGKVASIDNWSNISGSVFCGFGILANVPNTLAPNITRVRFQQCYTFNDANVVTWDTTNLTNGFYMFHLSNSFNQPIGNWNMSNFTTLESMFDGATAFNQPIGNWNVGNVTTMYTVFKDATAFNQPIGNWNVGNVTAMDELFNGATAFNQDLTEWCVTNIATEPAFFATGSALDANNYPVWGTCP